MRAGPDRALRIPRLIICVGAVVMLYEWAVFITSAFAPGAIGLDYRGIGTDWMVFDGAARMLQGGDVDRLYDGPYFTAFLNNAYSSYLFSPLPLRPWVNPPWFLLAMAPFAYLGFPLSYAVGQLGQLLLWLRAMAAVTAPSKSRHMLLAVGAFSPAVAVQAVSGQIALFTAALAVISIASAGHRSWLAGLALALLSIKPQFGPLILVYLVARGAWPSLVWAAVFGAVLLAASLLLLGVQPLVDWIGLSVSGLSGTGSWTQAGRAWGHSVYACLAASGLPVNLASLAQWAVLGICIMATVMLTRWSMSDHLRLATLLILMPLAAPHSGPYDMILPVMALVIAWSAQPALAPRSLGAWSVPLQVWLLPFFTPPLLNPLGRLTPLILLAALVQLHLAARRVARPSSQTP